MTPEDLVEIEAIRQLKARYFRLMDQKRWDEWEDVFCDDVVISTPDDTGEDSDITGNKAFRVYLEPILAPIITTHHGHMSEINIDGPDTASAVWSMEDHLDWPPESGVGQMWGTGWYEETYRKGADGQWRIASLLLRRQRVEVEGNRVFPGGATGLALAVHRGRWGQGAAGVAKMEFDQKLLPRLLVVRA